MGRRTDDVNDSNFFDDSNFHEFVEERGRDAQFADYMPGPNEDLSKVSLRSQMRPPGDTSTLRIADGVEEYSYDQEEEN